MTPERQHYRLAYPATLRPRLTLTDGREFVVLDLSESGLRFAPAGGTFVSGEEMAGTVRFRSGRVFPVSGRVLRAAPTDCALRLESGIPFQLMVEEQRALLQTGRWLAS
ncbi:MAG: PilZ domain-containing protein [Gemmatimonadales bacterium]|nr:PilZ domain-containing protein [Gemmatimonadales bacterium]